ncbi:MAG: IMPACT family protein [Bacilli bacterium]
MSKSIKNTVITEIIINKSKFICTLTPINSYENVLESLNYITSKYTDATHNCYAYILNDGQIQKCSDDGEPSKTAGYPILNALIKNELDNVLCVVTRYFGGVKLGSGGLIRAYTNSTMESINNAVFIENHLEVILELTFDFMYIDNIEHKIKKYDCKIISKSYFEKVTYILKVKDDIIIDFKNSIIMLTKNTALFS